MPSELLHLPPFYTVVGLYRLLTDPGIREPVLDKVKHASLRGLVVASIYAVGSWRVVDWLVRTFLVGGVGWFGLGMGKARARVGEAVKESRRGGVWVGAGGIGMDVDLVLCGLCRCIRIHSAHNRPLLPLIL